MRFFSRSQKSDLCLWQRRQKRKRQFNNPFFEKSDFKYHDNYFGGEPFGGREVVFYQNKLIYLMTYYGRISDKNIEAKNLYFFLQEALRLIPEDYPFRGPAEYKNCDFEYKNTFFGEVDNFSGEEIILKNNQEVYQAKYAGGFVNL